MKGNKLTTLTVQPGVFIRRGESLRGTNTSVHSIHYVNVFQVYPDTKLSPQVLMIRNY
uniref:Uncharacterized protein n=1 Tax=Octopus bimaculoides TaxID=37653 RepID=A0A0L8GCR9_OCTBM